MYELAESCNAMRRQMPERAARLRRLMLAFAAVNIIVTAAVLPATADTFILQGSTTFNRRVIEPHQATIEQKSGHELTIVPNRSMLGIIALLEGRAHMAMLSAPLETEVNRLKQVMPGFDYDRLQAFEVSRTRAAFVVNHANPVRKASLDQLRKVLTGEITDWRELGGKPAPIRVAFVGAGGGVITAVESELLKGQPVSSPNVLHVRTALQLMAIVEQEPNVLAVGQLSIAKQKGLPEIVTDAPVEQILSLVTFGSPTPPMKAVIDAARTAVDKTM
jgi:phosphate transport system substrate-binding protein